MAHEVREVHPFSKDLHPEDRRFDPVVLPSEAETPDPKGSSVQELVKFSDTIPEMELDDSELSGTAATGNVAKATMPPRVPRPGKPVS